MSIAASEGARTFEFQLVPCTVVGEDGERRELEGCDSTQVEVIAPPFEEDAYAPPDRPGERYRLFIRATEVAENGEFVTLRITTTLEDSEGLPQEDLGEEERQLTHFSMPFMDFRKFPSGARYAISLRGIDSFGEFKQVKIKTTFFPESYLGIRDRPDLGKMLAQLQGTGE